PAFNLWPRRDRRRIGRALGRLIRGCPLLRLVRRIRLLRLLLWGLLRLRGRSLLWLRRRIRCRRIRRTFNRSRARTRAFGISISGRPRYRRGGRNRLRRWLVRFQPEEERCDLKRHFVAGIEQCRRFYVELVHLVIPRVNAQVAVERKSGNL